MRTRVLLALLQSPFQTDFFRAIRPHVSLLRIGQLSFDRVLQERPRERSQFCELRLADRAHFRLHTAALGDQSESRASGSSLSLLSPLRRHRHCGC
jgi:hypothetical protein